MSYILIILAVLVLLNTYPLLVSQSLVFRTKETAMKSSVKMVESALSGLPELTEENVGQALASVEETGVSRLLVTDTSGCILFDTREGGSAKGMYAMYTEIVQALDGSDAFYCRYDSHAFLSRGASPVVYRNRIIGAVYAYEYDTQQAELLQSFQTNLTRISLLIAFWWLPSALCCPGPSPGRSGSCSRPSARSGREPTAIGPPSGGMMKSPSWPRSSTA